MVPRRRSDIYVFCLFNEPERAKADPLNLDQWVLYISSTKRIDEQLGDKRRIKINGLKTLGALECKYHDLKQAVDTISDELGF